MPHPGTVSQTIVLTSGPSALPRLLPSRPVLYRQESSTLILAVMPSSPAWARRHTVDVLARWGMADLGWAACQIVSELVTNSVAALSGEAVPVRLRLVHFRLRLLPRRLLIEVFDADSRRPVPREAANGDENGRGLRIVAALADGMEVTQLREGKTVTAWLRLPDTASDAT